MPLGVFLAGTGRPQISIHDSSPCEFSRACLAAISWGLKIASRRPLACAFRPARALPRVKALSLLKPERSAPIAAHGVRTGARLIEIRVGGTMRRA
jgi:hypothetical protein